MTGFPDTPLTAALLPHAFDTEDGAHDMAHLLRVWRNVQTIMEGEGGDAEVLLAATILHDSVWVDKLSPDRPFGSRKAAAKARALLQGLGWPEDRIDLTCHAIEAHSFSAGIPPETVEAKVLQDADRLDALGHIGVARCFATAGQGGQALYHLTDPTAHARPLDEVAYALDHFQTKLLRLGEGFQTKTGRALAAERTAVLRRFFEGMLAEVS